MPEGIHLIDHQPLTIERVKAIIDGELKLELSASAAEKVVACRAYLDQKIEKSEAPIYGVNTGFGSLCDTKISKDQLSTLQSNLVRSHACGTGDEVPKEVVRIMLLLKIQNLSYGHSAVQLVTIQRMIDMYNKDIYPKVYQLGSLGASGDLAPLAHLSLPLIGSGEVSHEGKAWSGEAINQAMGWDPIVLQAKEGLALLNGTQFMSAYATYLLMRADRLIYLGEKIAALSFDAYDGRTEPFIEAVHRVRAHEGQLSTAQTMSQWLEGSEIASAFKAHVQDPYSFRCIPQVHGASKDALAHVRRVVETEINAVTDNPTVFPDEDLVISAGNFHGQPLALALDFMAIAVAEMGSISERRTYKLISGQRGLPPFLVADPGLNSGFMIPQYTAASIVSQNKQLCTPASVDTIDSSNGQEDHVSMGANAATKTFRVVDNYERIMAIELFNAAQALEFRRPQRSSEALEAFHASYRKTVAFVDTDVEMHPLIEHTISFLKNKAE